MSAHRRAVVPHRICEPRMPPSLRGCRGPEGPFFFFSDRQQRVTPADLAVEQFDWNQRCAWRGGLHVQYVHTSVRSRLFTADNWWHLDRVVVCSMDLASCIRMLMSHGSAIVLRDMTRLARYWLFGLVSRPQTGFGAVTLSSWHVF